MMFTPVTENLLGVLVTEHTLSYLWGGPGRVICSFSQRGNAISVHFSSNKEGLRHIKPAINDFCMWTFKRFDWCTMILAQIKKPSVARIVKKCGFFHVADINDIKVYSRVR